jgi:pimeloyl-ACP methyl ester carboxylesterase
MSLALKIFRLKNQLSSLIVPSWTAKKAMQIFLSPRRFPPKVWELIAENSGTRININKAISAIKWKTDQPNPNNKAVLLAHGWESRGTQMSGFVPQLLIQGYDVVALDMPGHGHSIGDKSDPLKFAETLILAENKLGKFDAIIGHSMGAGAIGIAVSQGLFSKKLVLISGPSSIENTLTNFCKFIGLNIKSTSCFLEYIGDYVGINPSEVDKRLLQMKSRISTLVIHDENDLEIPFNEANRMLSVFPNSELFVTNGLGHRKILKSNRVLTKVNDFLHDTKLYVLT